MLEENLMARNRMIKPEFFTSKSLSQISIPACYMFAGLWCFSDDGGVSVYNLRLLLGNLYAQRTNIRSAIVKKWVAELKNGGQVIHAVYKNVDYLVIAHWHEHQKIDHPSCHRILDESIADEIRQLFFANSGEGLEFVESREGLLKVYTMINQNKKEKEKEKEKYTREFIIPNLEEIKEYCKERNNSINPERFYNYYAARDWKYGKYNTPLRDWKAAMRTWEINESEKKDQSSKSSINNLPLNRD